MEVYFEVHALLAFLVISKFPALVNVITIPTYLNTTSTQVGFDMKMTLHTATTPFLTSFQDY